MLSDSWPDEHVASAKELYQLLGPTFGKPKQVGSTLCFFSQDALHMGPVSVLRRCWWLGVPLRECLKVESYPLNSLMYRVACRVWYDNCRFEAASSPSASVLEVCAPAWSTGPLRARAAKGRRSRSVASGPDLDRSPTASEE